MFQPLDCALPMVSVRDIGGTAAAVLVEAIDGIIELHGLADCSPQDIAAELAELSGRSIEAVAVPRETWQANFRDAGYSDCAIGAFCDMFDGFNEGRVAFEGTHQTRHGVVGHRGALIVMLGVKQK